MVVLTDVRLTLRNYFDPGTLANPNTGCKVTAANLTDSDGNPLKYESSYEKQIIPLKTLFHELGVNLIFVISDMGEDPVKSSSGNIGTAYKVGVFPVILDKWSSDGSVSTCATVALHLAEQEVKRVVNENCVGSYRRLNHVSNETERVNSSLLWGLGCEVTYIQWVSVFGTYTVANRRFYNTVKEWRVGVSSAAGSYSCVGYASGLGPVSWAPDDPWVKQRIAGGSLNVFQTVGGYSIKGRMQIRDYEAITQMLKTIDVVAGSAGTQTAVDHFTRNIISYFAVVVDNTKIVNTTDGRTAETSVFVFSNTKIAEEPYPEFDEPGSPWVIEWYSDQVVQTDA